MLNKISLTTFVAAAILMGLSCCNIASAQVSDAQVWNVQTPNGGAYENDGFFFGAEGLYWALPSPKSAVVGNADAAGENAFSLQWTVRNNSTVYYIKKGDDDDDDDDDDDTGNTDGTGNTGGNGGVNIGGGSDTSVSDLIKDGYTKVSDKEFLDYTADTYGPIGILSYTTQHNDWNTNMLETQFHVGQRYNFGFMSGHNGWECAIFTISGTDSMTGRGVQLALGDSNNSNGNSYLSGLIRNQAKDPSWQDCTQVGDDLRVDRLLVQFDTARMWDKIDTWGVELNYLRRAHSTPMGTFEMGLGARYMKWDEEFGFWGGSDRSGNGDIYSPNFLDDSTIETEADNNMVGPQLGLRWTRQTGRFGMEILGKFTAAYNAQSVKNTTVLGSNGYANAIWGTEGIYGDLYAGAADDEKYTKMVEYYAQNIGANGVSGFSKQSYDVFSPIVELGVKFKFDLTNKIQLSLGWSGIYAGNIARPAGMTDYSLDMAGSGVFGVSGDNKSDVFMHGFVFGIVLNR